MSSLTLQQLIRAGSSGPGATKAARISIDYVVDGKSLLAQLVEADGGQCETLEEMADGFMGCFVKGFESDNLRKSAQLVAAREPDTEEGRYLLYVCPECGDIGCGAYGAKVRLAENDVEWYDFAYENGYEPGRPLPSVGPFCFSHTEYASVIGSAGAA
jgi:hypothetical protein